MIYLTLKNSSQRYSVVWLLDVVVRISIGVVIRVIRNVETTIFVTLRRDYFLNDLISDLILLTKGMRV